MSKHVIKTFDAQKKKKKQTLQGQNIEQQNGKIIFQKPNVIGMSYWSKGQHLNYSKLVSINSGFVYQDQTVKTALLPSPKQNNTPLMLFEFSLELFFVYICILVYSFKKKFELCNLKKRLLFIFFSYD